MNKVLVTELHPTLILFANANIAYEDGAVYLQRSSKGG